MSKKKTSLQKKISTPFTPHIDFWKLKYIPIYTYVRLLRKCLIEYVVELNIKASGTKLLY